MKKTDTATLLTHVLIISSDNSINPSLLNWLSTQAESIKHCSNFESANLIIKNCDFDLVISDYRIDDGIATDLIPRSYPQTLFIVISSQCSPLEAFSLAQSGVQHFFPAALNLQDLQHCILDFCSAKPFSQNIAIQTFGGLRITKSGAELIFSRKSPHRLLAIVKLMAALAGTHVPIHQICDTIWEHDDGDCATNKFYTNIHRLRNLLGKNAIVLKHREVGFNPDLIDLDIWRLQASKADKSLLSEQDQALFCRRWLPEDDSTWLAPFRLYFENLALRTNDWGEKLKAHG